MAVKANFVKQTASLLTGKIVPEVIKVGDIALARNRRRPDAIVENTRVRARQIRSTVAKAG